MVPEDLATETVELLTALLITDEYGTPTNLRDWDNALPPESFSGCSIQPMAAPEYLSGGRVSVMTRLVLWAPLSMPLTADKRVRRFGTLVYEVDGEVQVWPDIDGLGHVQAMLKAVRG